VPMWADLGLVAPNFGNIELVGILCESNGFYVIS
jgi:hypothetical protein